MDIVTYALLKKQLETKANLVDGKVPADELPSYVDDVVEYDSFDEFPAEGESGKIYVALDTGKTYRWSGSEYIQIGGGSPMVETTYSALKAARDAGTLVPGMQYRITDYQCTTITSNTSSAGHQFDIIVTADSENKLNEVARAMLHEGDTYFADNKLSAWKLWYCLDNDSNRFGWADYTNGKGVIYRMIDEFNNDVPYDFKNILFTWSGQYTNAYTFYCTNGGYGGVDLSIYPKKSNMEAYCYSNTIREYYEINIARKKMVQQLNFTVFRLNNYLISNRQYVHGNYIDVDNYRNALGSKSVSHGDIYMCDNWVGPGFQSNTVDGWFNQNYIVRDFHNNTLKQFENNYVAGFGFQYNTIGGCVQNYFGRFFAWNKIGNNFYYNRIGGSITNNTIGNYFQSNTIMENFYYNAIGSVSDDVYVQKCTFETDVAYISLTSEDTASSSNQIQYVHIHSGVKGTSSSDMKTISVSRGLNYDTDYYPINSVRREI